MCYVFLFSLYCAASYREKQCKFFNHLQKNIHVDSTVVQRRRRLPPLAILRRQVYTPWPHSVFQQSPASSSGRRTVVLRAAGLAPRAFLIFLYLNFSRIFLLSLCVQRDGQRHCISNLFALTCAKELHFHVRRNCTALINLRTNLFKIIIVRCLGSWSVKKEV